MRDTPSFKRLQAGVALAVLVALAVVIAANASRARADSLRVASARNLQQWGIALTLHLMENENQLPDVGDAPVSPNQTKAWFNVLPPYISEKPLASLPSGERPRPGVPSLWIRPGTKTVKAWDPGVFFFNYGMNRYLQPLDGTRSFRIHELNFPGNIIFLTPTEDYCPSADPGNIVLSGKSDAGAHILFCDGHVQLVPGAILVDPATLTAGRAGSGVSWFGK